MGLLDTLQGISENAISEQSKPVYGTVTAYYDGTVTVETDEGVFENIKCVNIPKIGTSCILLPVDDEYNCIPNEIDDTSTIYAMGLGKFTVKDNGDLIVDLPIGVTNYWSLNNNGDLIVGLDSTTNQRFKITDGCVIYEE